MSKAPPYIVLPLFLIWLLSFSYGLIYYLGWDHENSVSEWLTVILYILAGFYYARHNKKHFGIFPVLIIFFFIFKELDWFKFVFQFFDAMSFYEDFWKDFIFRAVIFSPVIVAILVSLFNARGNIVIFLQQKRYLYFLSALAFLGAATQIIDKTRGRVPVWASFEEAGELFFPVILLVMFYMLKSETIFRERERK